MSNKCSRLCILCIVMMLALLGMASAEKASGTSGNLTWTLSDDGVLTISGEGEMEDYNNCYAPWHDNNSLITSVVIEAGITSIGNYEFWECGNLTSIEIPNSITSIGNRAFYECSSLTSIEIPDSVTSIGEYAFSGCSSLTSIEIPVGVTSIEHRVFEGCISLTSVKIPDSVTSIGEYAFYRCSSLTSIEIPDSVTSIGSSAFSWCRSLTSIEIPDGVTSIGNGAFDYCGNLTCIEIPDSVTSIGSSAFYCCGNLTSIKIPNSITSIGDYVFCGCSSLTNIEIPDSVTSIGYAAFSSCSSLTSIEIPAGVTSIGTDAFSNCYSLTFVYFCSSDIPEVSKYAFEYIRKPITAYYPSSWSETPTGQYGGTITWVRVDVPAVSKQPAAVKKEVNENAVFTVSATGTNLSYQWQVSTDGGNTWKNSGLTGNKTKKLTVKATAARNGYMFRCLITDCAGQTVASNAAKLTVGEDEPITISTQPKKVTAHRGTNAVFTVSASSSTGLELSYQWQASTDAGKTWKNSKLSGNKTSTLTIEATTARNGYQFRCIVSDAAGNSVTSDAATLTVEAYIKFKIQPLNQKVTKATKVEFKVSADSLTGSRLSYRWQASTDGGKTWKNSGLSGNKTAILSVEATDARSGYLFRCVVTDANGKSLTSSAAVMTVSKVADTTVKITSFTASQVALGGTSVKFNVEAQSSTGTTLTYQWQVSTDGGKTFNNSNLAGKKTATLIVDAIKSRNNYQFRCVITDKKNNSVISDAVKLTVK